VITDEELARAIEDRPGWRPASERAAVYEPAGIGAFVKVTRVAAPIRASERYAISVIQEGHAIHTRPAGSAVEAVTWAERVSLK
jgi:hypothetical protein